MNKTNNSQATNSTCGSKNKTFINKNRIPLHNPLKNSSTTGSYVTYVNLYLHPNSHNTTNATNDTNTNDTNTSKNLKASKKPMCNNKECH
jgi:hypothetical protein